MLRRGDAPLAPPWATRFAACVQRDGTPPLQSLIHAGLADLPRPASGATLARWRALAAVAEHDLSLVKLFEGHTDALAILQESGDAAAWAMAQPGTRWGTWCAEPPQARLQLDAEGRLDGTKAWCSGAAELTHALVSCWNADGQPCLAAVALSQPGVQVTAEGWRAVGMARTRSVEVRFSGAAAHPVGPPGFYLARPGFWQGGAGIAACWFGGARGLAHAVLATAQRRDDAFLRMHLGAIDCAMAAAADVLGAAARWIDAHPGDDALRVSMRTRLAVEAAATQVIDHAGRALGAGPLCRDAVIAQRMADLPVFLRQSHAERDMAALGHHLATSTTAAPWTL